MIVKPIITFVLCCILLFAILHQNVNAMMRIGLSIIVGAGIVLSWFPDLANVVANLVGVGRGTDLMLYVWILISMMVTLMIYTKFVNLNHAMTTLVRKIALDNPEPPKAQEHE